MRRPALALILLSVALARAEEPRPGRIVGRVRVAGPRPAPRPPIDAIIDAAVCGPEIPDESLLVDHDGGVAHAVVVVRGVKAGAPTERLAVIVDNAHCRFVPRVQVVTRGQGVRVRSSDPVLHNAHPVLVAEPEVSIANLALAVPGQTMDLTRRLAATLPARGEALVRLACDVHPWMRGWLVVLDHPYAAVTGADGTFTIANVPPGKYKIQAAHRKAAAPVQEIEVKEGAPAKADFTLEVK